MANEMIRDPARTAIAISYRNPRHIAAAVLPRKRVASEDFSFYKFDLGEAYQVPDTKVGPRGVPAELEMHGTLTAARAVDHGLKAKVPQREIDRAPEGVDVVDSYTMHLTDAIDRRYEVTAAGLIFLAATYATGFKAQLTSTGQWSHADSDPVLAILNAMDAGIMGYNHLVLGAPVATRLRTHPKILKGYNGADGGAAPLAYLADLIGIPAENIHVGQTMVNTAKKGQTVSLAKAWGKHAALLYIDPLAEVEMNVATFGMTAVAVDRDTFSAYDKDIGAYGGQEIRVAETRLELVCANNLGYFFEDAVA